MDWWKIVKRKKRKSKLVFIHTPKCGGTYASQIFKDLGIKNKHHQRANVTDGITFTIIRDPVDRFESLMNYRLSANRPRQDWPDNLRGVYKKKHLTLNTIVKRMTNKQIKGFSPYKTLVYWTKNVDIIITMNKLHELLTFFGYKYDESKYKRKNVSKKTRGKFDEDTRARVVKVFAPDVLLYNKIKEHYEKLQTLGDLS